MNTSQKLTQNCDKNSIDNRKIRRLKLLQKRGLFTDHAKGADFKRATSSEELRQAYSLVHEAFVDSGFIFPNYEKMRIRPFETSPDTATFISIYEKEVVGVFSLIMDSDDLKLPSEHIFKDEFNKLRSGGRILAEMSNQAVSTKWRQSSVSTKLMQCVYAHGWYKNVDDLVCSISANQIEYFETIGFTHYGEIKSYSDITYDPVALMIFENMQDKYSEEFNSDDCLFDFWKRFFMTENPYISVVPFWERQAEAFSSDKKKWAEVFEGCRSLFENATFEQKQAMSSRLGESYNELVNQDNFLENEA